VRLVVQDYSINRRVNARGSGEIRGDRASWPTTRDTVPLPEAQRLKPLKEPKRIAPVTVAQLRQGAWVSCHDLKSEPSGIRTVTPLHAMQRAFLPAELWPFRVQHYSLGRAPLDLAQTATSFLARPLFRLDRQRRIGGVGAFRRTIRPCRWKCLSRGPRGPPQWRPRSCPALSRPWASLSEAFHQGTTSPSSMWAAIMLSRFTVRAEQGRGISSSTRAGDRAALWEVIGGLPPSARPATGPTWECPGDGQFLVLKNDISER